MNFKRIFRVIGWVLLSFVAFVALYILTAFILSVIPTGKEPGTGRDIAIYILTNGDHTDIIVPVKSPEKDWSIEVKFENTINHDTTAKYLAFGWGDKGFYMNTPTWAQLKFSVAFKAITGLGGTAVHTDFFKTIRQGNDCKLIMLSNEQYKRLIKYIDNSFKRDSAGNVINIKTNAHYDNDDAFYEANGRYTLFYTCNTWTNDALKACGQKACIWTPFDKGIFYQYRD